MNSDDDIEVFLSAFGLSPTETNCIIDIGGIQPEAHEQIAIQEFISNLDVDFLLPRLCRQPQEISRIEYMIILNTYKQILTERLLNGQTWNIHCFVHLSMIDMEILLPGDLLR